ncbi:hypothetical protein I79_002228 [Cricetulus griseus]|uniref:Uncharacterized protein n=1 Tax=Cricetulus griseus TaxID=10029 RepID=G3GWU5_CRIGR|nr:hypothetical protein I79_002228 [Cricetulus griseus]
MPNELHLCGSLTHHLLRCRRKAPEKGNTLLIFFRVSFAHKTGQMPWNSINISRKSDNRIAWFSIPGSRDKPLCRHRKFTEVILLSLRLNPT